MSDRELATRLRWLAEREFHELCPTYERIARALADDDALLARLEDVDDQKVLPVKLLAAVHQVVRAEPELPLAIAYRDGTDPWPAFRSLLEDRFDELAANLQVRAIQTNEVGRTAVVACALEVLRRIDDRPVALIEIGASAGLNLAIDRYRLDWGHGDAIGPADSPVHVCCEPLGDLAPPRPRRDLQLASRVGLDREPIDLADPEARGWLEACLWPNDDARSTRLAAAIDLAMASPPPVLRGDAIALLPGLLDALPPDVLPVVVSTWVLAYLTPNERRRLGSQLAAAGRPVAIITGEYPGVAPWVPEPARPPSRADHGASLLGLARWHGSSVEATALAWHQAHGRWIDWLDAESSDGPLEGAR